MKSPVTFRKKLQSSQCQEASAADLAYGLRHEQLGHSPIRSPRAVLQKSNESESAVDAHQGSFVQWLDDNPLQLAAALLRPR